VAANKTAQELTELFRQRSSEFLQSLIEDLSAVSSPSEWSKRLDDVTNPLEGIEVGQVEGVRTEAVDGDKVEKSEPRRYSAVEEVLDAINSGELTVSETDEDDIIRVFFKYQQP